MARQAVLAVSFGTSCRTGDSAASAVRQALCAAFPGYEVREAFTSRMVVQRLEQMGGCKVDHLYEAMARASRDKVTDLIVQPLHILPGYGYLGLVDIVKGYAGQFASLRIGAPLLTDDADLETVISAVDKELSGYLDGSTAVCLVGHGTGAAAGCAYGKLQGMLTGRGRKHYYVGTIEAGIGPQAVCSALKQHGSYRRAVLFPLLAASGGHVEKDVAGTGGHSWRSVLEKAGFSVICVRKGLGQLPGIRNLYVAHAKAATDVWKL